MNKRDRALALLRAGELKKKEIAAELKISLATLYAWAKDSGDIGVNVQADQDHQRLVADYYAEHTLAETAKYFGMSPPTILRYSKKYGRTRAGERIFAQGYFFGAQDRETLGLTEGQAQERNALLKSLGLDLQVSELEQAMFLTHGQKRLRLSVSEAVEMTKDCRGFLRANATRVKAAFKN